MTALKLVTVLREQLEGMEASNIELLQRLAAAEKVIEAARRAVAKEADTTDTGLRIGVRYLDQALQEYDRD